MGFFRGPAIAFPPSIFSEEARPGYKPLHFLISSCIKRQSHFSFFSYPKCHIYLATPKDINRVTLMKEQEFYFNSDT